MLRPVVLDIVLTLIASPVYLAIVVVSALRGRQGRTAEPVAWLLALLCLDMFAYNIVQLLADLTGRSQPFWLWLNAATACVAATLFYQLVISFVGQRRRYRPAWMVSHVYFGSLAVACVAPLVFPSLSSFPNGRRWAVLMLLGMAIVLAHGTVVLVRHLMGTSAPEKARTRLILAAVVIAAVSNATDLAGMAGATWSPQLGEWGLVVAAVVLAGAALRVLQGLSFLTAVNGVAIALTVVLAEVGLFRWVGDRTALAVGGTLVVSLAALLAFRFVVADYASERERTLAHASLGRMAAQMAHDIKNPLASIRGATQFLAAEREAKRSIDDQTEFLDLLVEQCDRLARIVDQYQRIGRAEPQLAPSDVNDAVREATKFLAGSKLHVRLADELPVCDADRDLIVIALENVLRNAHEAAVNRPVHVETGVATSGVDPAWIYVAVRDEGPGMDPRTRERALEGFFTTKSQGSGLGLAFVRRVVEAHRGKLLIQSQEGAGTTVRFELRAKHAA